MLENRAARQKHLLKDIRLVLQNLEEIIIEKREYLLDIQCTQRSYQFLVQAESCYACTIVVIFNKLRTQAKFITELEIFKNLWIARGDKDILDTFFLHSACFSQAQGYS